LPKIKHFGPIQFFLAPPKFLGWLRYCAALSLNQVQNHFCICGVVETIWK